MSKEHFAVSLQQDLLTLLCHDDDHGRTISKLVEPKYFEGDYKTIAGKAIAFWQEFDKAPKQHIADLLSDILENKQDHRAQTYRRILIQMIEVKDEINRQFVLKSMGQFLWLQRSKISLMDWAEILDTKGISGREEFDSALYAHLRDKEVQFDPGLRFSEYDKVIEFTRNNQDEFRTGIKVLDEAHVVPARGKLWMLLAPAKRGKTWALIQLGRMAFQQRKKVLHVSLEIEAEEVLQRYYQSVFGATKREDKYRVSKMEFDNTGELSKVIRETVEPDFTFASEAIKEELQAHIAPFGSRADYLRVKRFPMRRLTVEQLEAYLDYLDTVEDWRPDMVALDYPGIMKTDAKNHRISLGRTVEDLRGLSQIKNFALVAVHQTGRVSADAELVKATHAAEDWSIVCTADFIITFSQTKAEHGNGLARLFVDAGRSEADQFGVLITQSYKSGQFCINSIRLPDAYAKFMEGLPLDPDDEYEGEEGE